MKIKKTTIILEDVPKMWELCGAKEEERRRESSNQRNISKIHHGEINMQQPLQTLTMTELIQRNKKKKKSKTKTILKKRIKKAEEKNTK